MEQVLCEPVELTSAELASVAGGFFDINNTDSNQGIQVNQQNNNFDSNQGVQGVLIGSFTFPTSP
jgi:hypothetical protein